MITDAYVPTETTVLLTTTSPQPLKPSDLDVQRKAFIQHNTQWTEQTKTCVDLRLRIWIKAIGNRPYNPQTVLQAWSEMSPGYSAQTLASMRTAIISFERWLRNMGLTSCEAAQEIPTQNLKPKVRQIITEEEYLAMRAAAEKKRTGKFAEALAYVLDGLWMTGLAAADLASLQWSHWNPKTGTIHGNRAKTGSTFVLPLLSDSPFRNRLERMFPDRMKGVGEWPSVGGKHFIHNQLAGLEMGKKLTYIQRELNTLNQSIGIRKILLHDFRATFIARSLHHSDPSVVAMITGHTDPKALLGYAKPQESLIREVIERNRHDPGLV